MDSRVHDVARSKVRNRVKMRERDDDHQTREEARGTRATLVGPPPSPFLEKLGKEVCLPLVAQLFFH